MRCAVLLSLVIAIVTAAANCRGDEAAIRAPLVEGRADYETRLADVQKDIRDLFDQRTQRARNRGNLKEVDANSQSRLRFDTEKLIPKDFPDALRKRQESAVARIEKLYDTAQKAATRDTLDYLAEQLGKEKAAFLAEVRPVLHLNKAEPSHIKAFSGWYSTDGRGMMGNRIGGVIVFGGQEQTEAILAHPAAREYSEVVFPLDGMWETFTARVGVPTPGDEPKRKKIGSKLTFEVVAGETSLWRSQPSDDIDKLQSCRVDLPADSERLYLRAHCGSDYSFARAVWLEPRLTSLRFKSFPAKEPEAK